MSSSTFTRLSSLMFVCALALSSDALAANQPEESSTDKQFKAMDANGDGRVSREEHAAGAKNIFDAMDTNRDGKVTSAEMDAAHEKITGKQTSRADMSSAEKIKVIDTNGDGILTAEEHAAGSKTTFVKMDSNKNGYLSKNPSSPRVTRRCCERAAGNVASVCAFLWPFRFHRRSPLSE